MNAIEYKHGDSTLKVGSKSDYNYLIKINKGREMALKKKLRSVEEVKDQFMSSSIPYTTDTTNHDAISIIPLMHIWMEEKNTEIVSLQAQLQEQQTALLEKKIELAVLQEKMANQEQRMQQEIAMMKLSLMAEINMGSINKGSHSNPSFKSKIQIQSLHVHARSDLIQSERNLGEVSTQKVDEAELKLNNCHQENNLNVSTSKSNLQPIRLNSQKEATRTINASNIPQSSKKNDRKTKGIKKQGRKKNKVDQDYQNKNQNLHTSPVIKARKESMHQNKENLSNGCISSTEKRITRNTLVDTSPDDSINENSCPWVSQLKAMPQPSREETLTNKPPAPQLSSNIPSELHLFSQSIVPDLEDLTHGSFRSLYSNLKEDETTEKGNFSVGLIVESSTYRDEPKTLKDCHLVDAYGESGKYTGDTLQSTGMPHGIGTMKYDDNRRTYNGDWRNGQWHGSGTATFSNGDSYVGEYQFSQRHGEGKYVWSDGSIYEGEFYADKRKGKGVFFYPNGSKYIGEFQNGNPEGKGKYSFCGGGYYNGNWKEGYYDGYGVCFWNDGRSYKGEWRLGKAHGQGVETYPNGQIYHDGEWYEDAPVTKRFPMQMEVYKGA